MISITLYPNKEDELAVFKRTLLKYPLYSSKLWDADRAIACTAFAETWVKEVQKCREDFIDLAPVHPHTRPIFHDNAPVFNPEGLYGSSVFVGIQLALISLNLDLPRGLSERRLALYCRTGEVFNLEGSPKESFWGNVSSEIPDLREKIEAQFRSWVSAMGMLKP